MDVYATAKILIFQQITTDIVEYHKMMKTLNYVNMFNHGIGDVQDLLKVNGNPEAVFNVSYLTAFSVVVKDGADMSCSPAVHQLFTNLS